MISAAINEKLKEIYKVKLDEVEKIKLEQLPKRNFPQYKFKASLEIKKSIGLIAEIKKASPSKGIIRQSFDVNEIAREYNSLKVDAISVLTDQNFFQGNIENLKSVKQIAACPVLRKDFIIHEAQIHEAYSFGADIILLIVALLSADELQHLLKIARQLGLEVLVEAHTQKEIETALRAGVEIIGINNRDLDTFKVDINNAIKLASEIPAGILKVAESGLHTADDVKRMEQAGYDAVLIGEAFMVSDDISEIYRELFTDG